MNTNFLSRSPVLITILAARQGRVRKSATGLSAYVSLPEILSQDWNIKPGACQPDVPVGANEVKRKSGNSDTGKLA